MTLTAEGRHRELVSLLKGIADELRWAREDAEASFHSSRLDYIYDVLGDHTGTLHEIRNAVEAPWLTEDKPVPRPAPAPRSDELAKVLALADDAYEAQGLNDPDPLSAYRNLAEAAMQHIAAKGGEARAVQAEAHRDEWRAKAQPDPVTVTLRRADAVDLYIAWMRVGDDYNDYDHSVTRRVRDAMGWGK